MDPARTCDRILSAQYGVIERRQAISAGLTPRRVTSRLSSGAWVRVHRGVYSDAGAPDSWERLAMAAVLRGGKDAALAGRAAAYVWRLVEEPPEVIEVVTPRKVKTSGVRFRRRRLDRKDVVLVGRLRVTHPCHTMIDLAATLPEEQLEEALHVGLARRLFDLDRLRRRLLKNGTVGRRGAGTLRRLVEICPSRPPEQRIETKMLRILRRAGPPMAESQYEICIQGTKLRPDFAYPELRRAIEVVSYRGHTLPDDFERNERKYALLEDAGWRVLRVSARQVRDEPATVHQRVRRFLVGEGLPM